MIQANIDEKMDESQRDAYSVGYNEGFDVGFQKGREDTIKHLSSFTDLAIKIFIITSIIIGVIVIAAMSAKAQEKTDTLPVTLLVRISGRPWAFFHDGWEVRKVDSVSYMEPYWCSTEGCLVAHPDVEKHRKEFSHLLYLDSRKRPIRKEWVVYQTFKR